MKLEVVIMEEVKDVNLFLSAYRWPTLCNKIPGDAEFMRDRCLCLCMSVLEKEIENMNTLYIWTCVKESQLPSAPTDHVTYSWVTLQSANFKDVSSSVTQARFQRDFCD